MKYFQQFCKKYSSPFMECKGYRKGLCRECPKADCVAAYACDICGSEIDCPEEEMVEDGEKHFHENCLKKEDKNGDTSVDPW